jgi:hypothetical protein
MTIATTGLSRSYKDSGSTRVNVGKARLYERRDPGEPFTIGQCRGNEIYQFIRVYAGASLPDDEFGRIVLLELLNQLKLDGATDDERREIAIGLLPEIDDDDGLDIMLKEKAKKRTADQEARILGIDYQMRTENDWRTIGACDVTKAERLRFAAQKQAMDKAWKREQAGATPQSKSAARNKPWDAMGIGRTKYYALLKAEKAAAAAAQNQVREPLRPSTLPCSHGQNSSRRGAPCGRSAAALRSAGEGLPAVDPAPPCQAPSSHQRKPEATMVSERRASNYSAEPISRSAALRVREARQIREAGNERRQLLELGQPDAERARRLAELDRIIETARRELERRV